jgi:hypothetical protein
MRSVHRHAQTLPVDLTDIRTRANDVLRKDKFRGRKAGRTAIIREEKRLWQRRCLRRMRDGTSRWAKPEVKDSGMIGERMAKRTDRTMLLPLLSIGIKTEDG